VNIAILGYGKMGKVIEQIALERGHSIGLKIGSVNKETLTVEALKDIDVCIEFTQPDAAVHNLNICAQSGTPTISGTTGWLDHFDKMCNSFQENKAAFLYASNFSIGVNLFFELNKHLASLMNGHNSFQASIDEVHHVHKKDAPSGTGISLANQIIDEQERFDQWVNAAPNDKSQLPIISHREEEVFGVHIVNYLSETDLIQIKHEANSRKGFATGAVLAAEFVYQKDGIFSMKDVLKLGI